MIGARIRVLGVSMMLLLSGCGLAVGDISMLSAAPTAEIVQTIQDDNRSADVQNYKEKQLVMIFQGLLRMDKQGELAITVKQARQMTPLVRKSKDEGGLSDEEQKQVMDALTPEQKSFLEQFLEMKLSILRSKDGSLGKLSQEEIEKKIAEFKKKRNAERSENADQVNGAGNSADDRNAGKSIEQQLLELLETRQLPVH